MAIEDLKTNHLNIRMGYNKGPATSESVSYSYIISADSSVVNPFVGHKAPTTQAIANNLPTWMTLRQSNTSRGWKFINSWGMNLDNLVSLAGNGIANMFLETSDVTLRSKVYKTQLSNTKLFDGKKYYNLVYNGSFSIPDVARLNMPSGWFNINGTSCSLYSAKTLIGTKSVLAPSGAGIVQILDIGSHASSITASVFYYATDNSSQAQIIFAATGIDGTVEGSNTIGTGSKNKWERISVTLPINNFIYNCQLIIKAKSGDIYFSGAKIELTDAPTTWSASNDKLPYLPYDNLVNLVQVQSIEDVTKNILLHPINNEEEFKNIEIPTRIEKVSVPPIDLAPSATQVYGRVVSFYKENLISEWSIDDDDDNVVQRSVENRFDIFKRFSVRELRVYQNNFYGSKNLTDYTRTLCATCTRGDILFLACSEVYDGETKYLIKAIRPVIPSQEETYLESFADFDLDLDFSTNLGFGNWDETISSIGFSETEPNYFIVNTTAGRRFYYKFFYDYYFVDMDKRILYTLEKYDLGQLQVY